MQNLPDKKAQALNLALEAHAGQVDKAGKPYIHHLLGVARQGKSDDEFIVGVLHDFVEDGKEGSRESRLSLIRELFGDKISEAIDAISKKDDESRADYIARVVQNKLATTVKFYDLNNNAKMERLMLLDKETRDRLIRKYTEDRALLKQMASLKGSDVL